MTSNSPHSNAEMSPREMGDQLWEEGFEAREEHKTMKAYHKFSSALDAYRMIDRHDESAEEESES